MNKATATAHPNIALAKYWGKRPAETPLPAVPSLSLTLHGMSTTAEVAFSDEFTRDEVHLDGQVAQGAAAERVVAFIDEVRRRAGIKARARVTSKNDFPTAAGLASSASAFAALALAASKAAGLELSPSEVSDLARMGSISAARSVFGGFVELDAGHDEQEFLAASQLAPANHWDLRMLIAITEGKKAESSRAGMERVSETSPYFPAWVGSAPQVMMLARDAVLRKDFQALGEAMEQSAAMMHAVCLAARPALVYLSSGSVAVLHELAQLRKEGTAAYFTADAGPHAKALTLAGDQDRVVERLRSVPGVVEVRVCRPGAGAQLASTSTPPSVGRSSAAPSP